MSEAFDLSMMQRAIKLAMRGRGFVEPNPMVGCVIVKEGRLIGEGFHQRYGQAHAEPNALASCVESPAGATAYVTLEPCCHIKKQTPPCVPKLIAAKIARVVVGCLDPNPQVNGQGIARLREAGIEVNAGVMEAECKQLIAPFIAVTQYQRPYITLKWAVSADGKVAGAHGRPVQISNEWSRQIVHGLRGRCDAIAVGVNTVLTDDPLLTVRETAAIRGSVRYILDRRLRTPLQCRLVQTAQESPVVIATSASLMNSERAGELRGMGVEIVAAATLPEVVADWHRRRFTHVLVEAGPTLARAMMDEGYADRLWVFGSRKGIAEENAPAAPVIPDYFQPVGEFHFKWDNRKEFLNTKSPVYFVAVQSADALA